MRLERRRAWTRERTGVALMLAAGLLSGCAVGPNFEHPAEPHDARYTHTPAATTLQSTTGEPAQHVRVGARISAEWWKLFRSRALDAVVTRSIRENFTLSAARAALSAAQEAVAAARGGLFPSLDVQASVARRKGFTVLESGNLASVPRASVGATNVFSLGGTVSYPLDVFGGTRRRIEQQGALAEQKRYQLAAAYLTLTGNAVTEAIGVASARAQIDATEEVIASDSRSLSLVQQEFEVGKVARTDVLTAETQLASDRTALPPLQQQLSVARHALAVLAGRSPAEGAGGDFALGDFTLPSDVPLSLPSKLVHQRPDILSAEAQLHADSASIGVATAALFPTLTLSGSLDQQSFDIATLFASANRLWSISAGLLAPIFHGGTLRAQRRAAVDTYRASLATYEQTVLSGLQQVADTLKALAHDVELVDAQKQLLDSASQTLSLQKISYADGKTGIVNLIDAERSYAQARLGFVRAQAERLTDTAELFVALGGGWWQTKL